jgi:hypothetical protein
VGLRDLGQEQATLGMSIVQLSRPGPGFEPARRNGPAALRRGSRRDVTDDELSATEPAHT